MPLNTLPVELLMLIINHLDPNCPNLSNLAVTSKRLHRIVTPILYSNITIRTHQLWAPRDNNGDLSKLQCLTSTILRNPYLARCVRSLDPSDVFPAKGIEISTTEREALLRVPQEPPTTADQVPEPESVSAEVTQLINVVRSLPISATHMRCWQDALLSETPNSDAIVAVLLASLPSLQTLAITRFTKSLTFVTSLFLHAASTTGCPLLTNLTHLTLHKPFDKTDKSCAHLIPILRLPALKHMVAKNWTSRKGETIDDFKNTKDELSAVAWASRSSPPSPSSLTHLELQHCSIQPLILQEIAKQHPTLETLILHQRYTPGCLPLERFEIYTTLRPLRASLRHLSLSYESTDYLSHVFLLDLSQPSALETLRIPMGYLIADPEGSMTQTQQPLHTLLPPTLKTLHLTMPTSESQLHHSITDPLLSLLAQQPPKTLTIAAPLSNLTNPMNLSPLREEAVSRGVNLHIEEAPTFGWFQREGSGGDGEGAPTNEFFLSWGGMNEGDLLESFDFDTFLNVDVHGWPEGGWGG